MGYFLYFLARERPRRFTLYRVNRGITYHHFSATIIAVVQIPTRIRPTLVLRRMAVIYPAWFDGCGGGGLRFGLRFGLR